MRNRQRSNSQTLIIGLIIITIGSLFLAKNLNLISWNIFRYIFSPYGWMLYVGPILMANSKNRVLGAVFLGLGLTFLLGDLGYIPSVKLSVLWPLIIIGVGANFIYQSMVKKVPEGQEMDGSQDFVDNSNVFGGGDVNVQSQNFKGGKLVNIFGGGNYNLMNSKLADGNNNVMNITCIFGGCTFIVPPDWNVHISVTSIFGGFPDKRKNQLNVEGQKTLYITGLALFGGGDVKSY